jgi:hypothetical protein
MQGSGNYEYLNLYRHEERGGPEAAPLALVLGDSRSAWY